MSPLSPNSGYTTDDHVMTETAEPAPAPVPETTVKAGTDDQIKIALSIPDHASIRSIEVHTKIVVDRGQAPTEASRLRRPRLLSNNLQTNSPQPDDLVNVGPQGLVSVSVTRLYTGPAIFEVYAMVLPSGAAVPTSPDLTAWNMRKLTPNTGGTLFSGNVLVDNAVMTAPTAHDDNNTIVVWPVIAGVVQAADYEQIPIRAYLASATNSVTVNATQAIWFAWAPQGFTAPAFTDAGDKFRPFPLIVPQDRSNISVTCLATRTWTHDKNDPSHFSDANGLDGSSGVLNIPDPLLVPAYRSTSLNSSAIGNTTLSLPLNRLVGVWQPPAVTAATPSYTTATAEINIGRSFSSGISTFGTTKAKRLFLGFHDGQQWDDNLGSVNATVTWS